MKLLKIDYEKYKQIKTICSSCISCDLHKTRIQVVFGTGKIPSDIMIVDRNPRAEEDSKGVPMIGREGRRLDKALYKSNIKRDDIFITNLVLCKTVDNMEPNVDQIESCKKWLDIQIKLVKPKKIIMLGSEVTKSLIGFDAPTGREFYDINQDILFFSSYHPSYLLRNPNDLKLQDSFDDNIKRVFNEW